MADNLVLSAGTADGATLAADDIAGVLHQRVKVVWGTDGSVVDASAANPLPVVQTGTLNVGTVTTVTTVAAVTAISNALPAGNNNIGDVDIASIAAGTNNIGDVDVLTVPADPFGANADAASATGSISAKLRFIAATGIPITGNPAANVAQLAGTATDTNSGTKSAGTLRVVLATDQPALTNKLLVTPDSVALPANQSVNISQMNGVTVLMGTGVSGTGSQRVTLATDGQGQVADNGGFTDTTTRLDMAGFIFDEVAGTSLTENDAAAARIDSKRALINVIEDATTRGQRMVVTAAGAASTNIAQVVGTTASVNNGTASAGCQRVTIASDNTAFSVNATVKPATSGGLTTHHVVSAGSTNATNVKASAGQLYGWYIYNSNAAARKVAFHNTAGSPTAGASIFFTIVIPPSSAANVFSETGIAFSSGIAYTMVTDLTDAGATAVAASDLVANFWYA